MHMFWAATFVFWTRSAGISAHTCMPGAYDRSQLGARIEMQHTRQLAQIPRPVQARVMARSASQTEYA